MKEKRTFEKEFLHFWEKNKWKRTNRDTSVFFKKSLFIKLTDSGFDIINYDDELKLIKKDCCEVLYFTLEINFKNHKKTLEISIHEFLFMEYKIYHSELGEIKKSNGLITITEFDLSFKEIEKFLKQNS